MNREETGPPGAAHGATRPATRLGILVEMGEDGIADDEVEGAVGPRKRRERFDGPGVDAREVGPHPLDRSGVGVAAGES